MKAKNIEFTTANWIFAVYSKLKFSDLSKMYFKYIPKIRNNAVIKKATKKNIIEFFLKQGARLFAPLFWLITKMASRYC
jgi:hypothetical protein